MIFFSKEKRAKQIRTQWDRIGRLKFVLAGTVSYFNFSPRDRTPVVTALSPPPTPPPGGLGKLPYKIDGGASQKIRFEPQNERNMGVAQANYLTPEAAMSQSRI